MATGKQIKHYREKLKLTLEELSSRCGVEVGTISALEVRDSSRSKYFGQIAKALGLTLEQLSDEGVDYVISVSKTGTGTHEVTFKAEQPVATYAARKPKSPVDRVWPFLTVSPDEYWHTLTKDQRANIEFMAHSFVAGATARDSPSKHAQPAPITAAKTA